jgi:hypothetical protein
LFAWNNLATLISRFKYFVDLANDCAFKKRQRHLNHYLVSQAPNRFQVPMVVIALHHWNGLALCKKVSTILLPPLRKVHIYNMPKERLGVALASEIEQLMQDGNW